MEDKDEENDDKKSQIQSQTQSQARSQGEISKEAEEYAENEPSVEPSVTYAPSHHSTVVTTPSVAKSKSASEKSKTNIASPAKVSIKTTGENEPETGMVREFKGSSIPSSQVTVARSKASGGGSAGVPLNDSGSKGGVVNDSAGRGVVVNDSAGRGVVVNDSAGRGVVVTGGDGGGRPVGNILQGDNFFGMGSLPCAAGLLQKRSPFIHNPPYPEERRARVQPPRSPIDYIINLREDLADFQESHGLPRTRDYSFVSLGLALAQETGRAILSVFQMFTELFPILAIVSLILRFALDKLIEILETTDTVVKIKKSIVFALEMLAIMIPLWILFGTIIIPLITLILSLFKRVLRIRGGKKKTVKAKPKAVKTSCSIR